jgi:preprotein translocase subunit SecB
VREVVSDVVSKAGFPQLLLAPVNFEALYAQELQRKQAEAAAPADSTAH